MSPQEFAAWSERTRASETRWQVYSIMWLNQGRFLAYRGGVDGIYAEVSPDGVAAIGTYEGAVPHIGEALFHVQHSRQLGHSAAEALIALRTSLRRRGVDLPAPIIPERT